MKIQLKRSNVLDGGVAKAPTADQMEYGELALNYSATDPSIFIKNSSNAVIKIAGEGAITDEWKSSNNFLFPANLNSSVLIGSSAPDTPTIRLNVNGSATFASDCVVGENTTGSVGVNKGGVYSGKEGYLSLFRESSETAPYITCSRNGVSGPLAVINGDGSASFSGVVYSGGNAFNGGASGSRLSPGGNIYASAVSGTLWGGYTTGSNTFTSRIDADGTASFSGRINVGAASPDDYAIAAYSNSAVYGGIYAENNNASGKLFVGQNNGNEVIALKANGSATFASTITSPSFNASGTGSSIVWYGGTTGNSIIKADGNASFAGNLTLGTATGDAASRNGWLLGNSGYSTSWNLADGIYCWYGQKDTTNNKLVAFATSTGTNIATASAVITADGSATFQSTVETKTRYICLRETTDDTLNFWLARNTNKTGGSYHHVATGEGYFINASVVGENASISLNMDGTAEFAGNIKTGAGVKTTGAAGAQINADGLIASSRTDGKSSNNEAFYIQVAGDEVSAKEKVVTMFTDGSAKFSSYVESDRHSGSRTFLGGELLGTNYGLLIKNDPADTVIAGIGTDGSAEFASSVVSKVGVYAGDDADAGSTKQGALIGANGSVKASRPTGANPIWYGYTTGNATPTSYIYADGSATFAGTVTADSFVSSGGGGGLSPTGAVIMFAGSTPPTGWLECDGQAAPSALAAVLGQANVPDLRGEFVRGFDNGRGVDSGRNLLSTQADEFGAHKHVTGANRQAVQNVGPTTCPEFPTGNGSGAWQATSSTVGGTETRPRNVALMYIIKT